MNERLLKLIQGFIESQTELYSFTFERTKDLEKKIDSEKSSEVPEIFNFEASEEEKVSETRSEKCD